MNTCCQKDDIITSSSSIFYSKYHIIFSCFNGKCKIGVSNQDIVQLRRLASIYNYMLEEAVMDTDYVYDMVVLDETKDGLQETADLLSHRPKN